MNKYEKLIEKLKELNLLYEYWLTALPPSVGKEKDDLYDEIASLESELAKEPEVDINTPFFGNSGATVPMKKPEEVTAEESINHIMRILSSNRSQYDNKLSSINWLLKSATDIHNYIKSKQINMGEELKAFSGHIGVPLSDRYIDEYLQSKEK